jgi:hypothetical protein
VKRSRRITSTVDRLRKQDDAERNGAEHGEKPRPWRPPVPLDDVPEADPFPVDVLPAPLRQLVEETAWAMNCPPDYVGVPVLTMAGAAVGNARHLAITRTHAQPPCLYAAIVGHVGATKSPPLKLLQSPFHQAQQRYLGEWEKQLEEWKKKEKDPEDKGKRPTPHRCIVSDTTTESLGLILSENPRGVLMAKDELMGLVAGMNQYKAGKGHDRQVYLSLWSGDAILIDRKSDRDRDGAPLYVTDPFTAIVGGVQPSVLAGLRGDAGRGPQPDDGFLDRFLFVYPKELPAAEEQWREVSQKALDDWKDVVDRLLGLEMVGRTDPAKPFEPVVACRPYFVRLSSCGRTAWQEFTRQHAAELNAPDFPDYLRGPWSKLRTYGARLALIVHTLRSVCGETAEADADADAESVGRAASLVAYFKSHARKVYMAMDADERLAPARRILACLARHPALITDAGFTRNGVYQYLRRYFKRPEAMDSPLRLLIDHRYIREDKAEQVGPGRRSDRYEVNPEWDRRERTRNPQNPRNDPDEAEIVDSVDSVYGVQGREPGEEG